MTVPDNTGRLRCRTDRGPVRPCEGWTNLPAVMERIAGTTAIMKAW